MSSSTLLPFFFFFNDTATTEIYTLSLHDALPICCSRSFWRSTTGRSIGSLPCPTSIRRGSVDRKSTRLNSSHQIISYAVFCLKKKNSAEVTLIERVLDWVLVLGHQG